MTNHVSSSVLKRALSSSVWLLMIGTAVLLLIGIGLRSPWPADEPRFALIAKEMVATGQWFFPTRAGEYYPDKPPLFMWCLAFFYWLCGSLKIAFLLPSALAGLLTVYSIYDLGKRLWDPATGIAAGLLLLFSFQFLLQAKTAQIDALVCCFITLANYALLRFTLIDARWRWYYLGCFFMGLGVITKGVGFLPLLMLIPYVLMKYRQRPNRGDVPATALGLWRWVAGPLVMIAAIGLWLGPMLWLVKHSQDPALHQYANNILFRQTITRYADSWHHIKPFWYYVVQVIPVFWLPLSLLLPWLVGPWLKALKENDGRILLPLGWIGLTLLFFSLSPGKRGVYILPALPMLALISAPYIRQIFAQVTPNRTIWWAVTLLASTLAIFGLCGLMELSFANKLANKFSIEPWWFFLTVGGGGLCLNMVLKNGNRWAGWPVFMIWVWGLYSTWGYILLSSVKTPANIYDEIGRHIDSTSELALVNFAEQFVLFSPYPITHFGFHTAVDIQVASAYQWLKQHPAGYVLLGLSTDTANCFDKSKGTNVGYAHRENWVLLSSESMFTNCNIELSKKYSNPEKKPQYFYYNHN